MPSKDIIQQRFKELADPQLKSRTVRGVTYVDGQDWGKWSSSALNLIQITFGTASPHYLQLKQLIESKEVGYYSIASRAVGVFNGAKEDFEKGCYVSLDKLVSGEVFIDFLASAKKALDEGNKDVAAVLACAALEDALKRFAKLNDLNVVGKEMAEIINALKAKGLVGGSSKSILETMPKTRNAAMHADWTKISTTEVGGVIGYTEQFLLQNFS